MRTATILFSLTLVILIFGCSVGRLTEEEYVQKAQDSMVNGDIESAVAYYESLVRYYPESENIEQYTKMLLDVTYRAAEEFVGTSKGEKFIAKAITLAGADGDSLKQWFDFQAAPKIAETDPETAKAIYAQIPIEGYYRIAQVYLAKSDFKGSIEAYKKLVEVYPDNPDNYKPLFMIAFNYAEYLEDYPNAKTYFEKVIVEYPDCELVTSAKFMLDNMGKSPDEMQFIDGESDSTAEEKG